MAQYSQAEFLMVLHGGYAEMGVGLVTWGQWSHLQEGCFGFSACGYPASRQVQLRGPGIQEDCLEDILGCSLMPVLSHIIS